VNELSLFVMYTNRRLLADTIKAQPGRLALASFPSTTITTLT